MVYRILITFLLIPALAFSYTVVRKDGKVFSGKLVVETSSEITLKDQEGVTIKFKKEQIDWDKTTIERQKVDEKDRVLDLSRPQSKVVEVRRVEEEKQKWTGDPISIDFKDIDIRDLFRFLAETGEFESGRGPWCKRNRYDQDDRCSVGPSPRCYLQNAWSGLHNRWECCEHQQIRSEKMAKKANVYWRAT